MIKFSFRQQAAEYTVIAVHVSIDGNGSLIADAQPIVFQFFCIRIGQRNYRNICLYRSINGIHLDLAGIILPDECGGAGKFRPCVRICFGLRLLYQF